MPAPPPVAPPAVAPADAGTVPHDRHDLADAVLARIAARRPGATICPSEVARALSADEAGWRALMPAIRDTARALARDGRLRVTQRGRSLDPEAAWHGPIRLAAPAVTSAADGQPSGRDRRHQVGPDPADPQP